MQWMTYFEWNLQHASVHWQDDQTKLSAAGMLVMEVVVVAAAAAAYYPAAPSGVVYK
jgi:hypothetical protein